MEITFHQASADGLMKQGQKIKENIEEFLVHHGITTVAHIELIGAAGTYTDADTTSDEYYSVIFKHADGYPTNNDTLKYVYIVAEGPGYCLLHQTIPHKPHHFTKH